MTDEERIASYRASRDEALTIVRDIDEQKCRYSEARGNDPMRDVTDAYRSRHVLMAERLDKIADAWERMTRST